MSAPGVLASQRVSAPAPDPLPPVPRGRSRRRAPLWLLVPALVVAAAMLLPPLWLLIRAGEGGWAALSLLADASTLRVLANSALLAITVTAASIAIAVPVAWLTTRTDLPARRTWGVLTTLPLVVPTYVGGFVFMIAFGPRGMVQGWLAPLGVDRLPSIYGFTGAAIVLTLFSYPYVLLTVRGALLGLDPALEESARSLGLGPAATFRRVVLPQLRPAVAGGGLLVALYVLSDFGAVSMLRYQTFTRAIYTQYSSAFDRTPAAVLALLLVAFTVTLLVIEHRARGARALHRSAPGSARRATPVRLGRWRPLAVAGLGVLVTAAVAVPLAVLGYWLVRGVSNGEPLQLVGRWAANSLLASGLGALVAVAAALPVAVLAVRHRSRLTALIERTSYLGFALPGVVVALALVFFGARYGGALYQTLPMLVLAYVVLFLPQAVAATRSSLLQVPPALEEASRSLGRSGPATFTQITLPLVRPGVLAGGALVFLTAMKELPATLLLGPTGFSTLATGVWSATTEAFFARGAASALLLIGLTGIPLIALLDRRFGAGVVR